MSRLMGRPASIFLDLKKLLLSAKQLQRNSWRQAATLWSSPQPAGPDHVIRIIFSGLPPSEEVRVSCCLSIPQDKIECISQAHFRSDPAGRLDLSSSPSYGPSYQGVDPMGLFWSMDMKDQRELMDMSNIMEPLRYSMAVNATNGDLLLNCTVERSLVNPGVRRIPINCGGLIGTMFVPPGEGPFPAILTVLGGKGLKEDCAAYLANHGFVTLALAYYGLPGLPKTYANINIELFEDAVDFLQEKEFVKRDIGVGVFGYSKGGDISLSMASFLPSSKVRAAAVVGGAITSMAGTTNYKGITIPAHGFKPDFDFTKLPMVRERTYRAFRCMAPLATAAHCRVPFERTEADLLFVAGEDDMNWESQEFAEEAERICNDFGKENIKVEVYPGLGHLFRTPFSPICILKPHALAPKGVFVDMGGSDKQQHHESTLAGWQKIVEFFRIHL